MAANKKSDAKGKRLSNKTNYHAAFLSSLEILFWQYREQITMVPEKILNAEGIRIDILLIKKEPSLEIDSDIARIFREHNIIEYKSFDDALNIDVFAKVMAYAYLYKSKGQRVNAIPFSNMCATIYRHGYPGKFFKTLKFYGAVIENPYPGVYYVKGQSPFPIQILVGKELDPCEYSMFRILMPNAFDDDIRRFKDIAMQNYDAAYHRSVDNILQISVSVNRETYARLRKEEPDMCEALRELMKDDFDKATEEANKRADEANKRADEAAKRADEATKKADVTIKEAEERSRKAEEKSRKAEEKSRKAEEKLQKAEKEVQKAEEELQKAEEEALKAKSERDAAIKACNSLLEKVNMLEDQIRSLNLRLGI